LLALGNQRCGTLHANLHVFLSKSKPKIFLGDEAFGKGSEGVGLFCLREEIGEQARECSLGIKDATAH
jgi:hypothetical protein